MDLNVLGEADFKNGQTLLKARRDWGLKADVATILIYDLLRYCNRFCDTLRPDNMRNARKDEQRREDGKARMLIGRPPIVPTSGQKETEAGGGVEDAFSNLSMCLVTGIDRQHSSRNL